MARVPKILSFEEIRKRLRQVFTSDSGINDYNEGSAVDQFITAAAASDFQVQGSIIAALNANDIDRAEGVDLDNLGEAAGISRPQSLSSTGFITVSQPTLQKVSTKIYAGAAAPSIGSTIIYVSSRDGFPNAGSIYLGRGSNNVEGPILYSSIVPIGNYFQINLSAPTVKNHNVNESVILSQGGDRVINAGAIVQTKENSTSPSIKFRILNNAILPDGEDIITDIQVICTEFGSKGNVSAGAISEFASPPFAGATVTNPTSFVSGRDKLTDIEYRLLIKNFQQTRTKGTDLAIKTAAVGVTSSDDNKTSASASLRKPSNRDEPAILFIDDKTAYQPIFSGQGFEQVIENAKGGERFLQLQNEDITKALVETSFEAPFSLTGSYVLAVKVGGVLSEHTFQSGDFSVQNAANTFEVVNSINSNTSLLFSARASKNSKKIVLFAKAFSHEDIEVVFPTNISAINANDYLSFSNTLTYSLRLYKDDELLYKDGEIPTINTRTQDTWGVLSGSQTINIQLDQQTSSYSYTINDADFVEFGYAVLSNVVPLSVWAKVFNKIIPGITASQDGNTIKIVSNKGASNNAKIAVTGGSLLSLMFGGGSATSDLGKESDYSLNRSTGQVELTTPLKAGENITAGSKNTQGFLMSSAIVGGSINLPAQTLSILGPKLWVMLDDQNAQFITSLANAGSTITISNPSTDIWRFTSSEANAFADAAVGDFVTITDNAIHAHDPDFIGHFKVVAKSTNYFDIKLTQSLGTASGALTISANNKINFIRSLNGTIWPLSLPSGLQTITAIANSINQQILGGKAIAVSGKFIKINSNTYDPNKGSILIAGVSSSAESLGLLAGAKDDSAVSHTAFVEATVPETTIPSFVHSEITYGDASTPYTLFDSDVNLDNLIDRNKIIKFLNPFGSLSSNKDVYSQLKTISGNTVEIRDNLKLKDILVDDRFFVSEPYNFTSDDNIIVIVDEDPVNKAFTIPFQRKATVASVISQSQITAYDADSGPTANFANQFGDNFDFNDFKVLMRARAIVDPSGTNNKFIVRSAKFGPSGERMNFSIDYPTAPNAGILSTVNVKDTTDIKVFLASGAERLGGTWDSTTQFDVTIPGSGVCRYTYNGSGTAPNFVSSASIVAGDTVSIATSSNFSADNVGVFKIINVTSNYFEVSNFSPVAENNIQLNSPSELRFYPLNSSANKASDLKTYIDNNLNQYISIELLESGTGVISTSTFDDSNGNNDYFNLIDGENHILLSNIGTTAIPVNSFTFKKPLAINESDPNYSHVNEVLYLIPTMADHLKRFLNIFAVTGISSVANINVSDDASRLQIYSNLFGTSGSVNVTGGSANQAAGLVITNGTLVGATVIRNPLGISRSGSNVIVEAAEKHTLKVGDTIIISNVNNSTFNGRFQISAVTDRTFTYPQTYSYPTLTATGIERSASIAQITTSTAHNLAIGDRVNITGVDNSSFNGLYTVASIPTSTTFTATISYGNPIIDVSPVGAVRTSGTTTITTTTNHNIIIGDVVTISGVSDSSFNGTYTVTAATATTFDYAQALSDASSGGGTVSTVQSGNGSINSIESNGGYANLPNTKFNIDISNGNGLQAGQYIKIQNSNTLRKNIGFDNSTNIQLQNAGIFGQITITSGSGSFQESRAHSGDNTTGIKISKHGDFTCITWNGAGTDPDFIGNGIVESDWIQIGGSFSLNNQGIFQVIETFGNNTVYIKNDASVEEEIILSAASDLQFYSYDSIMPGDKLIITTEVLGSTNVGTFVVKASPFPTSAQLQVTTAFPAPGSPTPLSSEFNGIIIKEGSPFYAYRMIENISQDPSNANNISIVLDSDRGGFKIDASVSPLMTAISKMGFTNIIQKGEDSYKYYGGLISAVGKKIRGQAEDPVGYQGVAAAGSYIEITSPLPREIAMSIVVRNLTSTPFAVIKSRVQSAVASYINSLGVGESVVFSKIVSVIQELNGVEAMAISAPVYDSTHMQIVLNEDEKAVVTNVSIITVSLSS